MHPEPHVLTPSGPELGGWGSGRARPGPRVESKGSRREAKGRVTLGRLQGEQQWFQVAQDASGTEKPHHERRDPR